MVQTKRYAGLTAANTKKVAMAAPMFSIIIPTLNVAAVLPACLDSIARQTCGDFELVLVDGGSTDETLDIANIFAPNLGERLIIHRDTDQGVYDAMNRGVDLATGTWLLFLGADDSLYEADTLARVAAFIGEHEPSDLVYGDVIMRSTNFRWGGAFDLDRLLFKRNICHQAIFYRRGLFGTIGPYNLRYRVLADWDFNIRCFSNPALVTRYMHVGRCKLQRIRRAQQYDRRQGVFEAAADVHETRHKAGHSSGAQVAKGDQQGHGNAHRHFLAAPTLARYHRNVDSMPLGGVILGGQPASCKTDTSNSLRGAAPVKLFAPASHYVDAISDLGWAG